MESMGGYHATLARLRSDGIRFAIDDFGTGYSSLKYLRSFPADKLKVAQEFVSGVPEDRNGHRARPSISKDMEMTVIAEGAETTRTRLSSCALCAAIRSAFQPALESRPGDGLS